MASVYTPPPVALESFALSEPQKKTAAALCPGTAGSARSAYSSPLHPRLLLRGPRHKRQFSHLSQQTPVSKETSGPTLPRALGKSSTVRTPQEVHKLRQLVTSPLDVRRTTTFAAPSPLRSHRYAVRSAEELLQQWRSDGDPLSSGESEVKGTSTPEDATPPSQSAGSWDAVVTNARSIFIGIVDDSGITNPPTVRIIREQEASTGPEALPNIISYPTITPRRLSVEHDRLTLADTDSVLSSRPGSGLPAETIDQLETLAEELRGMPHKLTNNIHPRSRVASPRHGPRPYSPSSLNSNITTPREWVPVSAATPRASKELMRDVDSGFEETHISSDDEPDDAEMVGDVLWIRQYPRSTSQEKGKWKTAWIEDDGTEGSPSMSTQSANFSLHPATVDHSEEPCYPYDPLNAPEFLAGTSTSQLLQATQGFHSRRTLPRARTRKLRNRPSRPTPLVLAPGFQPDLSESSTDLSNLTPALPTRASTSTSRSSTPRIPTPRPPTPRPPTPRSTHSTHRRELDLKSLELLIGVPLEPKKPKASARLEGREAVSSFSTRRGHSEDIHLRRTASRASISLATPQTVKRSSRRRRFLTFLRRLFRRWMG